MKRNLLLIIFICLTGFLSAQQSERKKDTKPFVPAKPLSSDEMNYATEKKAPQYTGGREAMFKFIRQEMKYPLDAKQKGIEGDVQLKFTVGMDGSISNIQVVQGLFPSLDAEAVRVVSKMPKWIPGKYGTQSASMNSSLIIGFHLTD